MIFLRKFTKVRGGLKVKKILFLLAILTAAAYAGALPVRRSVSDSGNENAFVRERNVPQTLMYAEIQSYLLVENYLHYFSERPLFHDSSLRG